MSNDDYPSLILLFNLVWKENQAQMAQNRMMNLSSSQELPHLKPKAFRPSWLLPGKSIHFYLPIPFFFLLPCLGSFAVLREEIVRSDLRFKRFGVVKIEVNLFNLSRGLCLKVSQKHRLL